MIAPLFNLRTGDRTVVLVCHAKQFGILLSHVFVLSVTSVCPSPCYKNTLHVLYINRIAKGNIYFILKQFLRITMSFYKVFGILDSFFLQR